MQISVLNLHFACMFYALVFTFYVNEIACMCRIYVLHVFNSMVHVMAFFVFLLFVSVNFICIAVFL